MDIAIFGTGYVGLVTGACLAKLGHTVICVDIDENKISKISQGNIPFYEPGLPELVKSTTEKEKLFFTIDSKAAIDKAEVIFNCVGTPQHQAGRANLSYVKEVAKTVATFAKGKKILVNKSTVPPGTAKSCQELVVETNPNSEVEVVSNPEFLKEGAAIHDFTHPDKIVIGTRKGENSDFARSQLRKVYLGRTRMYIPFLETNWETAEIIKYANNAFLATKISFINELANICDAVAADIKVAAQAMGMDYRISSKFLNAGIGYGGSCLTAKAKIIVKDKENNIFSSTMEEIYSLIKKQPYEILSFNIKKKKIEFSKINIVTKRPYNKEILKINTRMNKSITCTSDHPFIIYEDNKFKTISAKDLTVSHWLPSFTSFPSNLKRISIDLIYHLINNNNDNKQNKLFDFTKVRVRPLKKEFLLIKDIITDHFSASRKRDILRSNCMNLKEFLSIESKIKSIVTRNDLHLFTSKGNTTYCPAIIKLNSDFCRFVGYYLSEGSIHYEKSLRGIRARTQIHFNINEKEYIKDLKSILTELNIQYSNSIQSKNKTNTTIISSRILAFLLDNILKCGTNSYTANIPDLIFSMNKNNRLELLKGLFRGDGHVAFPKNTNSVVYDFGSISKNLVDKMILLFHSIGIIPSYKTSISKKSTAPAHFIRISTKKQILALPNFKDNKTQSKIKKKLARCKEIKPCGFKQINNDFVVTRINKIESSKEKLDVYSLEVEKNHTFVTDNGLIVHNCFPKDVRALVNKAKENGYEAKLLNQVDLTNEAQKIMIIEKIKSHFNNNLQGKTFAVLGLSFKPKTSDMREAPSLVIIPQLVNLGATVKAYDPIAQDEAKKLLQSNNSNQLLFCESSESAYRDADAIILLTEWDEFRSLNFSEIKKVMKEKVIFDGRNIYEPEVLNEEGFVYYGVGRK